MSHRRPPCLFICALLVGSTALAVAQQRPEPPAPPPSAGVREPLERAKQLLEQGAAQEALQNTELALTAARKAGNRADEGWSHAIRADVLAKLGRLLESAQALERAASVWAAPEYVAERVPLLTRAALAYVQVGDTTRAADLLVAVEGTRRDQSIRPRTTGTYLLWAARELLHAGLLEWAQRIAGAALSFHAPDELEPSVAAAAYDILGSVAFGRGDLEAAQGSFERSLEHTSSGGDIEAYARALNGLGAVAVRRGDLSRGRGLLLRALKTSKDVAPRSAAVATGLLNIGMLAFRHGDFTAARDYLERALTLHAELGGETSPAAAKVLSVLGGIALEDGQLQIARRHFQQAHDIVKDKLRGSLTVANSLTNLGLVDYYDQASDREGHLSRARNHFEEALRIRVQGLATSVEVASSLNNLGLVHQDLGDVTAARTSFERALSMLEPLAPRSIETARTLANLAVLARAGGDLAGAERFATRAWSVVRAQPTAVSGDEAQQAFASSRRLYPALLVETRLALNRVGPAFVALEEGRAQALERTLLERAAVATDRAPLLDAYRAAQLRYEAAQAQVMRAAVRAERATRHLAEAKSRAAHDEELAGLRAGVAASRRELEEARQAEVQARAETDHRRLDLRGDDTLVAPSALTLKDAYALLGSDTLYVAFSVGSDRTTLFIVGGGRVETSSIALSDKALSQLVNRYRAVITNPTSGLQDVASVGREVFAALFPQQARIRIGSARRLLLSPDGPLWDLPFAALVPDTEEPARFLGLTKELSYTPSLSLLVSTERPLPPLRQEPRSALVVGDVVFAPEGTEAPDVRTARGERASLLIEGRPPRPLPFTKAEALEVASLYGSEALAGPHATEGAVRRRIEQARIVHLATHGYLHPRRAMASGVLLTSPPADTVEGATTDDGVLQAWEILGQLTLTAELVVLSACETGRGVSLLNEGVVGLSRSFQAAGARAVVASQWSVADASTASLMVVLHRRLGEGIRKDAAMRDAMQSLHAAKATAHPFYWAPFLLIGSRQALTRPN